MRKYGMLVAAVILVFSIFAPHQASAAGPVYTVGPDSKTYKGNMMNFSTYTQQTKHYYLLRSYLEQLEKKGGGTLVLKKGTYSISNVLYVPSNVTIKMKDGVKLVKGTTTGTKEMVASHSMFQLVRPSKAAKKGAYGGYNGEKNIAFIGEGNVSIDLKYYPDSIAIIMGHNKNVSVKNITFTHMKSGHFIEMDASDKVNITNNKFIDSKPSVKKNKEAINIDTPDRATKGWSQIWSKFDRTPNRNVTIEKNEFRNLDRAIGTHKYSEGKYHENVVIKNNVIEKTRLDAIRVMNWSNPVITQNTIKDVDGGKPGLRGILVSGAINPTFKDNTFNKVGRPMQFLVWKNEGPGSQYKATYNKLTEQNLDELAENQAINTTEDFIRINSVYKLFNAGNTVKVKLAGN